MKKLTLLLMAFITSLVAAAQSPQLLKDINPSGGSDPQNFAELNGTLFFFADNGSSAGLELWRSDGTEAGTTMVGDVNQNTGAGTVGFTHPYSQIKVLGDQVFWAFYENLGGTGQNADFHLKIYKTGVTGNASLVHDFVVATFSSPPVLVAHAGKIYFVKNYSELWSTDGNVGGATLVRNVSPNRLSDPQVIAGELYFYETVLNQGNSFLNKKDIYKTDGTSAGTQFIERAVGDPPHECGRYELDLFELNGKMAYTLFGSSYCFYDTWIITDDFPAIQEQSTPIADRAVREPVYRSGKVYYFTLRYHLGTDYLLRVLDVNGVQTVKTFAETCDNLRLLPNGTMVFRSGTDLWMSDGTEPGTIKIKEFSGSVNPRFFKNHEGDVLFVANEIDQTSSIWKTDGTAGGTNKITDFPSFASNDYQNRHIDETAVFGDTYYFAGNNGQLGAEPYQFDLNGGPNACPNLLVNPGFEDGLNGWTTTGQITLVADAYIGSQAVEACGSPASISQIFPAVVGQEYTGSVWGKGSLEPNNNFAPFIWLRFLRDDYSPIGTNAPSLPEAVSIFDVDYTQKDVTATAPPDAAYVHLLVAKEAGSCFTIDALELCEGAGAGNNTPELFPLDFHIDANASNSDGSTQVAHSFNLKNTGTGNIIDDFSIIWRISNDEFASVDDYVLRSEVFQNGLAPSETVLIERSDVVPAATLPVGDYFLILCLDDSNDIVEESEQNNCQRRAMQIFEPLSDCQLTADVGDAVCDNNGTPDDTFDDTFTRTVNISNPGGGTGYETYGVGGWVAGGIYGQPFTFGPANIAGFDMNANVYLIRDNENPDCQISYNIIAPPPCSNGSMDAIDLELAAIATPANPAIYDNTAISLTLTNSGTQTATGVKLRFYKPDETVYTGGNEWTATQGTFDAVGSPVWDVGAIPAGGAATLTVHLFMLTADPLIAYAQVDSANEQDTDSTPANGNPFIPNEDDEVAVDLNGGVVGACEIFVNFAYPFCDNNGTPNDDSDDVFYFAIRASGTNTGASWTGQFQGQTFNGNYNVGYELGPFPFSAANQDFSIADDNDPDCTASVLVQAPNFGTCSGGGGGLPCTSNLLQNGDFENGLSGWAVYSGTASQASMVNDANNGNSALRLDADKTDGAITLFQSVNIPDASVQYAVSFFGKRLLTNTAPNLPARNLVRLFFLDASGAILGNERVNRIMALNYNEYALEFSCPANTATVEIHISISASGDAGNGSIFLDDFCLQTIGGQVCDISAQWINKTCNDNGTPTDNADDTFTFDILVNGTGASPNGWTATVGGNTVTGNYDSPVNAGSFLIADGNVFVTIIDNDDPSCQAGGLSVPTAPCSNSAAICELDVELLGTTCDHNGTPDDSTDDLFYVEILITGNNTGNNGWETFATGSSLVGVYGQPVTLGPFLINSGEAPIFVRDVDFDYCNTQINATAPAPCSNGSMLPDLFVSSVSVPGSANLGASIQVTAIVQNIGAANSELTELGYYLSTNATFGTDDILLGSEDIPTLIPNGFVNFAETVALPANYPPGDYFILAVANPANSFVESSFFNNVFSVPIQLAGASGQIDLELSLAQPNPDPAQYSDYSVIATLTNNSNQLATGVMVGFPSSGGVVYLGGNEYVASQGNFDPNGGEIWNVGSLPGGSTATLTVNYFLLQNGAPNAFAQVIAANEPDIDSAPGNGGCCVAFEDDEATLGGSPPPLLQPDLVLENLVIPNTTVEAGQVLSYNVDIKNAGNGPATDDFIIRAYISNDDALSTDDVQDGIITTGNFGAGLLIDGVPGASTISNAFSNGIYYLILKIDADETINESNENNNLIVSTFTITSSAGSGDCAVQFASGNYGCVSQSSPDELDVIVTDNGDHATVTIDKNGNVLGAQPLGAIPPEERIQVSGGEVIKRLNDGTVIYQKSIPPSLQDEYDYFTNAAEYNGGFVLFAYKNLVQPSLDSLYAIRTDANLNPVFARYITNGAYSGSFVSSAYQVNANHIAATVNSGVSTQQLISLIVLDDDLNLTYFESLASGWSVFATLKPSLCDKFNIQTTSVLSYCKWGACYTQGFLKGRFDGGIFVLENSRSKGELSSVGVGTQTFNWSVQTSDGGTVAGTKTQEIPLGVNPINNTITFTKTLNGNMVWEKDVKVPGGGLELVEIAGELAFIQQDNGALVFVNIDCLDNSPPPMGDGVDIELDMTTTDSSPTIYGTTEIELTVTNSGTEAATGIVIEMLRPNGTVYTGGSEWTATQGTFSPHSNEQWSVGSLGAGETASLTVNYFILTENTLAPYAQVISLNEPDTDSSPDNGSCCTPMEDDEASILINGLNNGGSISLQKNDGRLRMFIDHIFPNPAKYWVNLDIYSHRDQSAVIAIYDQQGRIVHRKELELIKGKNELMLDISNWRTGAYNVIGRGDGHPAYGRFLKVWE